MKQCWTDGGLPLASIAMFDLWLKTGGPSSKAQATGWRDGARLCLPESWGWRCGQQHVVSYLRYPTQITQIFCNPRVYTYLVLASLRNRNRTARCDLKSSRYSATNSHSVTLSSDFLVQDMGRRRPIWAMTVARGNCSFPGHRSWSQHPGYPNFATLMHQMQSVIQDKTKPSILYNIIQYIFDVIRFLTWQTSPWLGCSHPSN